MIRFKLRRLCINYPAGDPENETNAKGLINLVDEVVDERLRLIWTSIQRFNADWKIKGTTLHSRPKVIIPTISGNFANELPASVQVGMSLFTAAMIANSVLLLPGKDFAVEEIVFSKLFTAIHGI